MAEFKHERFAKESDWAALYDIETKWGNLPHRCAPGAIYFVTFRLADSIPASARVSNLGELQREAEKERMSVFMDAREGSCVLGFEQVRAIVSEKIRSGHRIHYDLGEHVVACNHVHAVLRPNGPTSLSQTVSFWKRASAIEINRLPEVSQRLDRFIPSRTGGSGQVWQKEYFDRIIRNEIELRRIETYIKEHPEHRGFQK